MLPHVSTNLYWSFLSSFAHSFLCIVIMLEISVKFPSNYTLLPLNKANVSGMNGFDLLLIIYLLNKQQQQLINRYQPLSYSYFWNRLISPVNIVITY